MATTKKTEEVESPALDPERKVTIIVPRSANEKDCFVSINDKSWLIRRGVPVEVPWYVAEVITQAERQQMEADEFEEMLASKNKD